MIHFSDLMKIFNKNNVMKIMIMSYNITLSIKAIKLIADFFVIQCAAEQCAVR